MLVCNAQSLGSPCRVLLSVRSTAAQFGAVHVLVTHTGQHPHGCNDSTCTVIVSAKD